MRESKQIAPACQLHVCNICAFSHANQHSPSTHRTTMSAVISSAQMRGWHLPIPSSLSQCYHGLSSHPPAVSQHFQLHHLSSQPHTHPSLSHVPTPACSLHSQSHPSLFLSAIAELGSVWPCLSSVQWPLQHQSAASSPAGLL